MSEADARARAARRANWPGARYALGHEPDADLRATTTSSERLDMMWQLALDAWAMTGRPIPSYTRAETPGRLYWSFHERDAESE